MTVAYELPGEPDRVLFRAGGQSPMTAVGAAEPPEPCWDAGRRTLCPMVALVRERSLRRGMAGVARARERFAGTGQPPAGRAP